MYKNKSRRPQRVSESDRTLRFGTAALFRGDALEAYEQWSTPTCIISDGPYGLGKFPGEPTSVTSLAEWYAPHIAAWAQWSSPDTTLWVWCSERGWASIHSTIELHGWEYEEANVWDKGIAHIAGNVNSKTIRGTPVVTELAVRYTRRVSLTNAAGVPLSMKQWVREEWLRSGLPLYLANDACGVANAATRKYLTQDEMFYFPPPDMLVKMAKYCTKFGKKTDRPYFSLDGKSHVTEAAWTRMRAKWNHSHGVTNVWREPPVHGSERIKIPGETGYAHANQKPLALMRRQVLASTDPGDVVWEPFGGTCSASVAAIAAGRTSFAAEVNPAFAAVAASRLGAATEQSDFFSRRLRVSG